MSPQKPNSNVFTFKIGGSAGQGVKSSGITFARFITRSGYNVFTYVEYPSIIKGGHNVMQVNISKDEAIAPSNRTDFLVALNQDTINLHAEEMTESAGVIFDGDDKLDTSKLPEGTNLFPIPLSQIAKDAGGKEILINTVALGATIALLGGDIQILKNLTQEEYSDKGEEVVQSNLKAIELAYKYAQDNFGSNIKGIIQLEDTMGSVIPKMVINGNEAAALAAISAGVQFAAIYPMSPISNILHVLAKHQEKFGYVYKQPEDEIAAISMGLGAAFAGARSMTATSGGGFCLMSESYGLAGITETPLVIVEGMRGGPGTGLPTWSAQGDLRFVLHAHQDDFPRIILTPGDAAETFHLTMQAFNLAEKYQTPVVVLINKDICECDQSIPFLDISKYEVNRGKLTKEFDENFERYKDEMDGISVRSFPGTGNFFIANSDEHDTKGYSSEEIENRNIQMQKRMRKLDTCKTEDMPKPELFGPEDADITIVSWGSNKGSIIQALKEFDNVNFLHLTWISPFPTEEVKRVLEKAKHIINIEANYSMQMAGIIREKTGIEIEDNFIKYDGRPFYFEEIREKLNSILKG